MLKIVGLIRTLSFVLFLGTLGLVYAYLPIMVEVLPDRLDLALHKSSFFYYVVALFIIVNLFTWGLTKLAHSLLMLKTGEEVTAWFNVISPIINIYLSLLLGYVGVINNPLHVSAQGFAYLNYFGPAMLLIWVGVLFYMIVNKKSTT